MHPEHKQDFDRLAERLRAVVGNQWFYYLPNPGNWGDSLIREGAVQFFRHHGFEYRMIGTGSAFSRNFVRKPRNLLFFLQRHLFRRPFVYGGGGAFCEYYHFERDIYRFKECFPHTVVLPSTYQYRCDFEPAKGYTAFVRDRYQSQANMPLADFCPDMAFFIEPPEIEPTEETGYFLRQDTESLDRDRVPPGNEDISKRGNHLTPVEGFFERVGRCRHVVTDRLHVGIAGALLGRRVDLYPNSYFKTEAIYRSSIEGRFPNVTFHPEGR